MVNHGERAGVTRRGGRQGIIPVLLSQTNSAVNIFESPLIIHTGYFIQARALSTHIMMIHVYSPIL